MLKVDFYFVPANYNFYYQIFFIYLYVKKRRYLDSSRTCEHIRTIRAAETNEGR